uniref:BPTI/Kunitz inhibitor domain-containing protein n=1 Tax=Pseudonaja textilis TaxID=8673 RepID=A0A670ZP18_PSETE
VHTRPSELPLSPSLPVRSDQCQLPRNQGSCSKELQHFYYDPEEKKCISFVYHGCEGNSNNFPTRELCEKACGKISKGTEEACCIEVPAVVRLESQQTPPRGPLETFSRPPFRLGTHLPLIQPLLHWQLFPLSPKAIQKYSFSVRLTFLLSCTPSFPTEVCKLPADPGRCLAYSEQYYYNWNTKKCETFVYGMCNGNGNRFATKLECQMVCGEFGKEQA